MRGKRRIRQYDIELGGFAPDIEGSHVGQGFGVGMKLCVGDRQGRIKGNFALEYRWPAIRKLSPTGAFEYDLGSASWAVALAIGSTIASMTQSDRRTTAQQRTTSGSWTCRTSWSDAA